MRDDANEIRSVKQKALHTQKRKTGLLQGCFSEWKL